MARPAETPPERGLGGGRAAEREKRDESGGHEQAPVGAGRHHKVVRNKKAG